MGAMASTPQAIPVSSGRGQGLLRVVSSAELTAQEDAAYESKTALESEEHVEDMLASHIRARMTDMRNFRNAEGISERLLSALRTYKGMYDQAKLDQWQAEYKDNATSDDRIIAGDGPNFFN